MSLGYIYITFCPNNKIYIGQHQKSTYDNKYYGSGKILKNIINKYGKNKLKNIVLEWCNTIEQLNTREIWWINYFKKTSFNCINIDKGGKGLSALARHKLRKTHKNISNTKEHIERFILKCVSKAPNNQCDDKYYEITPVRRQDFKRRCKCKNLNFNDYIEIHTATKAFGKHSKLYKYYHKSKSCPMQHRNYDDEKLLKQYETEPTPRSTFKTSCKHRNWNFDDFDEIFAGWYCFPNSKTHRAKRYFYKKRVKE